MYKKSKVFIFLCFLNIKEVKMNWLIIAILIILAFVFLKIRFFLVAIILIVLFVYTTASRVFSGYDIDWKSFSGIEKATRAYLVWFRGVFDNVKILTSNAIKMDWSKNKTEAIKILEEEK